MPPVTGRFVATPGTESLESAQFLELSGSPR